MKKCFTFHHFMINVSNKRQKVLQRKLSPRSYLLKSMHNLVKHLRWSVLQKLLTARTRVLNVTLYYSALLLQYIVFTSIKYLIICFIVKYIVTERFSGKRGYMCSLKLLHTKPTFPILHCWLWTSKYCKGYNKSNEIQ